MCRPRADMSLILQNFPCHLFLNTINKPACSQEPVQIFLPLNMCWGGFKPFCMQEYYYFHSPCQIFNFVSLSLAVFTSICTAYSNVSCFFSLILFSATSHSQVCNPWLHLFKASGWITVFVLDWPHLVHRENKSVPLTRFLWPCAVIKDNEKWQVPVQYEKLCVTDSKAVCKGSLNSSRDFAVIKYSLAERMVLIHFVISSNRTGQSFTL